MAHTHEHHHRNYTLNRVFIFCILLNSIYVVTEATVGILYDSLGLLSDAGHNLSDVFSLLLALIAIRMSGLKANKHFTYGYKKSTILVSLLNAIILLVAVGAIMLECFYKLKNPSVISGEAISWTAGIGILINGLTAWLLNRDNKHDLNVRGAYLHMLMDTLVSVGVVVSGIIIAYTHLYIIDAIISLFIVVIIFISTFKLLKESLYLSLDAVPSSVSIKEIENGLSDIEEVESWHHLHIWAISTTENAATLHIVLNNLSDYEKGKQKVKLLFADKGVRHCTVECELPDVDCKDKIHL